MTRRTLVSDAVDALVEHRDLLALLLVWEIGKPWRLACADVDRCVDGARWYLGQIERQLTSSDGTQRQPLPGPGLEHRQLELPDERPGPRRAGPGPGGQCGRGQDAEPGRVLRPDARPCPHAPGRSSGHAALGDGLAHGRGAHPLRGDRRTGLRGGPGQRPAGRGLPRRHRSTAHARAGGPQLVGDLEFLAVGPSGPAHAKGVRVRQATLHGLSPLCGPAPPHPRLLGGVPAGRERHQVRQSAGRGQSGRSSARTRLRAGHPCDEGRRADEAVRRSGAAAAASPSTGARSATGCSSTPRTPRPMSPPPACSSLRHRGHSTTPSPSARWTRSSSSTPRPSSWRR